MLVTRLVETVFPARLGHGFRWLVGSSWVTNLGDGVLIAAGPLLIASQTRNPVLVSSAMIALQAPWLVFGLVAGALADRLDRRRVIMAANLARGLVLAVLCAVIASGQVNIGIVLGVMLGLAGLAALWALSRLEADRGWFLESGYFEGGKARAIRGEVNALCGEVTEQSEGLVDAFGIPDAVLQAPAGMRG